MDDFKFKGRREQLVKGLEKKGITNSLVLQAIKNVYRHVFTDVTFAERAYEDIALPIAEEQTISQPYTVAFMTSLLEPFKGMRVLEIGTGSGYQAAILAEIGLQVFSIERHQSLSNAAKQKLKSLGYTCICKAGDGSIGWPQYAPFDGIIVTAGGPEVPESLKKQLVIGGKLIIPVGDRDNQIMSRVTRISENEWTIEEWPGFRFVPFIGKEAWQK